MSVGLLGEKHDWWPTNFYSESAQGFLEYAFPRNKKVGISTANDAIRTIIDEKIGANYFHLFRLNVVFEEQIHKYISSNDIRIKNEKEALESLEIQSKLLAVDGISGPKNIGNIDGLDENVLQAISAEYLDAFKNNYQVHPYLN